MRTAQQARAKLAAAMQPSRSLLFYTLTATLPIIMIKVVLLAWPQMNRTSLTTLAVIGALTGFVGLGRLLYEMTLDIAGYPEFKLPIWSVFFLIIYLISAFAFLFFGLHVAAPGRFFDGIGQTPRTAFLDSLYVSLCDYIAVPPDPSIALTAQGTRYLAVIQGVISLFINVVIITKFVNTF